MRQVEQTAPHRAAARWKFVLCWFRILPTASSIAGAAWHSGLHPWASLNSAGGEVERCGNLERCRARPPGRCVATDT